MNFTDIHSVGNQPPNYFIYNLGMHTIQKHRESLISLIIVLRWINGSIISKTPLPWHWTDFLEYRTHHYPSVRQEYNVFFLSGSPRAAMRTPMYNASFPPQTPQAFHPSTPVATVSFRSAHGGDTASFASMPSLDYPEELIQQDYEQALQAAAEDMTDRKTPGDRTQKAPSPLSSDSGSTSRQQRSDQHARFIAPAKPRSLITSDKLQWNGHRTTFEAFAADMEGIMYRIGIGYLLDPTVQEDYKNNGMDSITTKEFWEVHRINKHQFVYDIQYLYGTLRSATKNITNSIIQSQRSTRDGLTVWIKFMENYAHGGATEVKIQELETKIYMSYDHRKYPSLAQFIDHFQAWIEELQGLGHSFPDDPSDRDRHKKRLLIRSLQHETGISHLLQTCMDNTEYTFEKTCNYLRTNSMRLTNMSRTRKNISTMLNTVTNPPDESVEERAFQTIQNMLKDSSPIQVYNALRSPSIRESLSIPTPIWLELEPELKKRIDEIRKSIREKKKNSSNSPGKIPDQYPDMKKNIAHLCSLMKEEAFDSGDETDDEILRQTLNLQVRANLQYAENPAIQGKVYAISDGGADSCILGKHAYVSGHTGRFAQLVGYDPRTTQSDKLPIVTAYIKVKAHNGYPVLLKINEAVYNANSPTTLLSEYQIRENGFICDSVAKKHKASQDSNGKQRLELSEHVNIPFVDREA